MKAYKDTYKYKIYSENTVIRDYYKYINWTQPTLTSNTSSTDMWLVDPNLTGMKTDYNGNTITAIGSNSMSTFNNVYKAMDSDTGNVFTLSASNVGQAQYADQIYNVFDVCFTADMKVTHIKVVCKFQNGYHCALKCVIVYKVDEDGTWQTNKIFNKVGDNNNTTLEADVIATRVRKLRFCLRPDWNNGSYPCQISNIIITASKSSTSTSSDYDYYIDRDVTLYKAFNI